MVFGQEEFDIRCEWGYQGLLHLAPTSDAVVIIDVLSFSTSVDIAVHNGATVYPYQWRDETALAYASSQQAILASFERTSNTEYSMSPTSLLIIPAGTRLVLPSPNGSTLSLATSDMPTFTGCLRNAQAVAKAASTFGKRIALIPAGEKWEDSTLRPALEDWIAAGARRAHLPRSPSPPAHTAGKAFFPPRSQLPPKSQPLRSGPEIILQSFVSHVKLGGSLK